MGRSDRLYNSRGPVMQWIVDADGTVHIQNRVAVKIDRLQGDVQDIFVGIVRHHTGDLYITRHHFSRQSAFEDANNWATAKGYEACMYYS
jgi:hypothetical protein